jgi:GT2 family glycosyltransferase
MNPPPWLGRDPVYGDLDGVPIGSAMFRREVFDAIGGFDETFRYSEDMDLLVRMREYEVEIAVLPEIVLYRRFHGDQMTTNAPDTPPLLRSLRRKLERERAVPKDGA